MFNQFEILTRLLLVVPASSAEDERSFSALRRLKTWLRSTMLQARLNHLALLNCHSDILDQLNLSELVREFVGRNEVRQNEFGELLMHINISTIF